jgi:VCBS repeat-containing protein
VNVTGANDAPVLSNGGLGELTDTAVADHFSDLTGQLAASDADTGDTLTYAVLNADSHGAAAGLYGSLTVNADGSYTYVPDAASINALPAGSYSDSFTVQVSDAHGAVTTATYTVDLTGANDTPTLSALNIGKLSDTAAADSFSNLTGHLVGHDVDTGDALTYAVLNANGDGTVRGLYGSLTVDSHGNYTYVPNATAIDALSGGSHTDSFTVQTTDSHGATASALLTVDVDGANDAPVINTDEVSVTQEGTQVFVHGLSVTDVDAGTDETFTLTATADSGTYVDPASPPPDTLANVNSSLQELTYTEPADGPATDKVTVTVTDGHGATDKVNLIFNLTEQGPVTLASTADKDVLFGTGYQDQFVFAANSNHDVILNFMHDEDQINLTAVVATDIDAAWITQNTSSTSSGDTLITINASDTILLKGVAHVQASDFIVHA